MHAFLFLLVFVCCLVCLLLDCPAFGVLKMTGRERRSKYRTNTDSCRQAADGRRPLHDGGTNREAEQRSGDAAAAKRGTT